MAKKVKLIQQRPNTSVDWHNASDEFKTLKESYVSAGKLDDQGGVLSEGDLIKTWTLVFANDKDSEDFLGEAASSTYQTARQDYNLDKGISEDLEVSDV